MVGTLLYLKMLHCKLGKRKSTRKVKKPQRDTSCGESSQVQVKTEKLDADTLSTACRVCLKEGYISIYGDNGTEIANALNTFAGIDIQPDDVYPKLLCQECHALVRGAILLRKTAQESDQILREPAENLSSYTDDFSVDYDDTNYVDKEVKTEEVVEKPKIYHCKKCDLEFKTREQLTEHKLSDEHENKRYTCKVCNNSYAALYFKRHMALHELEPTHVCDICGKKFIIQGQFTRHRMTHFYSLPFKCSLCPYKGRFRESLKMHMRSHTGEKPYQCAECPNRFVNKSNLNKHMLTHRGDHDYKCDSCGRGFYTKRDLELHIKVDHTGIKDHVCNICDKAFGYRKQMMKHQLKVHKRAKLRSGRTPLYLQVESKKQRGETIE